MNNCEGLQQALAMDCSSDYWSDVAIERAVEIASGLDPSQWEALRERSHSYDELTQSRLAEVLGEITPNPATIALLLQLLASSNSETRLAALSSLVSSAEQDASLVRQAHVDVSALEVPDGGPIQQRLVERLSKLL